MRVWAPGAWQVDVEVDARRYPMTSHEGGWWNAVDPQRLAAFMAVLVFVRHAPNIRRLARGEEPRIGGGRTPKAPGAA